ncbi:hypothetical protein [Pedobacter foliorum]|uniref:hypothetical protein n=1 Tax=Pedobacter foliorum TaxID=2739058 RepID=UPI0015674A91|nr:hypothetical protein [Pedobacter foliorum]NRF39231.1 hypothetical protein [Pedobacter foliorum]
MRLSYLYIGFLLLVFTACHKSEGITTDSRAKLSFSTDTLLFDTVFTSSGSTNKRIKVYNSNLKAVNISNIKLSGGASSSFSLIINGQSVNQKTNIQIDGKDSISIYVKVTIDGNNQTEPFIAQDSILFNTNGNKQSIALIAYGQNAIFINNQTISSNTTWTSSLPYIIYKSVTVAPQATLNILPGTKILFHGSSAMNIKGKLVGNGTAANPILFSGDRTESFYAEESGQWNGVHFYSSSSGSTLNYTIIKNAVIGIAVDSLSTTNKPKLSLTNSIVKNMAIAGFVGYNTQLDASNNLFYNAGQYLLYGVAGGKYNLKQNTFAGYTTKLARRTPSVYFSDSDNGRPAANLNVEIANNIIWGSLAEEFLIEKKANTTIEATIRNNAIKTLLKTYEGNFNLLNIDPGFIDPIKYNFILQDNSPLKNKGFGYEQ